MIFLGVTDFYCIQSVCGYFSAKNPIQGHLSVQVTEQNLVHLSMWITYFAHYLLGICRCKEMLILFTYVLCLLLVKE